LIHTAGLYIPLFRFVSSSIEKKQMMLFDQPTKTTGHILCLKYVKMMRRIRESDVNLFDELSDVT